MIGEAKPVAPAIYCGMLSREATIRVYLGSEADKRRHDEFAFIVRCGPSGTSVLGDIRSRHPEYRY